MKKRITSLLLALIMALSLLPVSVLAAGAGAPTPSAENGFVDEIYFPVAAKKSMGNTLERIQGYVFQQGTTKYDVILPDKAVKVTGPPANYFGITVPEKYISGEAEENLYYSVYFDDVLKTKKPVQLKTEMTRVMAMFYMNQIEVGQWSTLTIQVGTVDAAKTSFVKSDVYEFRLTRQASLHSLTVRAGDDALNLSPAPDWTANPYVREYSVVTAADEVTLKFTGSTGAKFFIGEKEVDSGKDIPVALSGYRAAPDASVAIVPITVKVDSKTAPTEATYRLFVSKENYIPQIKTQPQTVTVNKLEDATLSVAAETAGNGKLTYQWHEKYSSSDIEIPGATESTYSAPTTYADTKNYYCVITNTVSGAPFTVTSETASVTVNLNVLTAPQFYRPMELYGNNGSRVFFQNGKPTFAVYVASSRGAADQADGLKYEISIYRTDKKDANGELQITSTIPNGSAGSVGGSGPYYYIELPSQNVTGTWYYYAVVTVSKDGYESASRVGNFVPLTFKSAGDIVTELEGTGSASDPYLIYSQKDLAYVKGLVEGKNGPAFNFAGQTLAFANDIELDTTWTPIGNLKPNGDENDLGPSLQPFCGTIDGRNHTLRIADHGKCLLYYVRNAAVKNLNIQGDHIDGYGLVERYIVDYGEDGKYISATAAKHRTIDIENVTLKSGTKTLQSGFIGGVASGANAINIRNCTIEKGVVIGYDKQQSYIGSFAGNFNGTMKNCVSYATVYGVDCVGGLAGQKGQSMGACDFLNSAFLGEVVASGDAVGGIIGSGYPAASGTPVVQVHNCYVAADIAGHDWVGGIAGAESAHVGNVDEGDQYGVKGTTSITDTHYYGKLTATGKNVGGIIGFMYDFTKKSGEATNYFVDSCGTASSIGGVKTGTITGADRFGLACLATEFADGTVTAKLNNSQSGYSYKNWVQGEKYPVFSDKAVAMSLEASGNYKTTYTMGDALDLTGITLTAKWSDGTTSGVALNDPELKITGFDTNTRGQQTVTLSYGAAKAEITVTVLLPVGKDITVTFSLLGDSVHGDSGEKHTLADGNLEKWIDGVTVTVDNNATVLDVITKALGSKYSIENETGNYIQSITPKDGKALGEFTNGNLSGWMYTLNGVHPNLGVAQQYLNDGDVIVFHYTDDYTKEYEADNNKKKTAEEVVALIDAIGEVTLGSESDIAAARTAYDNLTEAQQAEVKNYDKLTAAEAAYARLLAEQSERLEKIYKTTGDYIAALGTPGVGSTGGEWMTIGLARSGRPVPAGYYDNVVEYVKAKADANERLHRAKVTDNARVILALTAIGKDVTNVGGHNLLKGLDNMAYVQKQGINGPIFTLIALDSHNYPTMGDVTREKLIQVILDAQLPGGGWNLSGENADTDMTAMAIQALAPYYKTNETVKAAVDKALEALSALQRNDGGFGSWGTVNSESCDQVIVALTALGIDPTTDSRFVKNGNTVLDALAGFYVTGGGFKHTADGERNGMATEQGYYALAAYYRFVNAQTRLYDMSDVTIQIDSHTHAFSAWTVTTPATCTTDGVETRSCACGETETRIIPATGHAFGAWTVTTPATCTTDGVETRSCACGETETRIIPATGHVDADHDGKCDVCQAVITPVEPGETDPSDPGKTDPSDPGKTDPTNPGTDTPATGDTGVLVWVIALPVALLAAALVLKRKEREA